jgi:hypothetical protein
MMIRIRFAWKSRGLVLGLLFGKTLGFNYGNITEFLCVM